jgi:hypothetical protein
MLSACPAGERVAAIATMRTIRRFVRLALVAGVLTLVCGPAPAFAVTVDEIVSLSRAGVSDDIILALIDRDKSILPIGPEQILKLRGEGVSEAVIVAMLKSGRAEGDDAARRDAAETAAFIASGLSTGPEVVIVGHGPDRPNTAHPDGFYSAPGTGPYYVLPYIVGGGRRHGRRGSPGASPNPLAPPAPPAVGFVAPWIPSNSPFALPPVAPVVVR